jgi:hypothetical protein
MTASTPKKTQKKRRNASFPATLVGEMWGHSDAVYSMVALNETSFASAGGDFLVALWKVSIVVLNLMRNNVCL